MDSQTKVDTTSEIDKFLSELVTMKVNGRTALTVNEVQDRLLDIRNDLLKRGLYKQK